MSSMEKYSLWGRSDDEEWLKRNAGCTDVLIMIGLNWEQVNGLMDRLLMLHGPHPLEVHPTNEPPKPNSVGSNWPRPPRK